MKCFIISSLLLVMNSSFAGTPALDSLTSDDFSKISKEFGANFVHTSVTPPNSLGALFGIELGLIAGVTTADETSKIITSGDSSAETFDQLPHAGIMAQLTVPFGISIEATMFPEKEFSDVSINTMSGALKWTFLDIPFVSVAARAHFSSSSLSYKTSTSVSSVPVDTTVTFDSSSWGTNLSAGLNLFLLRPYIGVGYVSTDNELGVNSTATIFDSSFTTATSAQQKHSGSHIFAGMEFDLFLIHIGAEYAKIMGVEKATAKFSFAF